MDDDDRPEPSEPSQAASQRVLGLLAATDAEIPALLTEAFQDPSPIELSDAAEQAVNLELQAEASPESGAPPGAAGVGRTAMSAGYRLGRLLLRRTGEPIQVAEVMDGATIRELAGGLEVDQLVACVSPDARLLETASLRALHLALRGQQVPPREDFAEWAAYGFSFGMALAVVEYELVMAPEALAQPHPPVERTGTQTGR